MFGPEIIEVATFRGHHEGHTTDRVTSQRARTACCCATTSSARSRRMPSVATSLSTASIIAWRTLPFRDYVGGMKDLQDGVIRLIGNPETRYREDPVRMLRAVRLLPSSI